MEPNKNCTCPENHKRHICTIRSQGLTNLVEALTNEPTVKCVICGAEANSAVYVCSPVTIESLL